MATCEYGFGFRLSGSVLLLVVLCVILPNGKSDVFAQSQPQSNYADLLKAKAKRFVEYGQDFIDFARPVSDPPDLEMDVAMNLQTVAGEMSDRLRAAIALLQVYSALSCTEDRPIVRPLVEREFLFYSQQIELSIKAVNLNIGHTKRPGVAAEAARMRDDLREVKSTLDSIKLQ